MFFVVVMFVRKYQAGKPIGNSLLFFNKVIVQGMIYEDFLWLPYSVQQQRFSKLFQLVNIINILNNSIADEYESQNNLLSLSIDHCVFAEDSLYRLICTTSSATKCRNCAVSHMLEKFRRLILLLQIIWYFQQCDARNLVHLIFNSHLNSWKASNSNCCQLSNTLVQYACNCCSSTLWSIYYWLNIYLNEELNSGQWWIIGALKRQCSEN